MSTSIAPFVFEGLPQRVLFGAGARTDLRREVERLGMRRVLVLSTPGQRIQADRVAAPLGAAATTFAGARVHTPTSVTDEAMATVTGDRIDGLVAVGGGSAIGLSKAIAMRTDLPQIALPTTYAGSEATNILGETSDGRKKTTRHARVLPEVVIYDVDLTVSLPIRTSVASGLNAIAHAVEALYARDANPVLSLMAEQGIATMASALRVLPTAPHDQPARTDALYGAWLCGNALGGTSMALHHKLCHVLGGAFDLPHAETHAIVLPHVMAYNGVGAPAAIERVARALNVSDAAAGVSDLVAMSGCPTSLRDLGMPAAGIDRAADMVAAETFWNPRQVTRAGIRAILDDAWNGARPVNSR